MDSRAGDCPDIARLKEVIRLLKIALEKCYQALDVAENDLWKQQETEH